MKIAGMSEARFGEVLQHTAETTAIMSGHSYRQVTVRLWGKGVVLRGIVDGNNIAAHEQSVVRAGQFIFSRIDARNAAFGLVPPELDGAVVSNDFPSFDVDKSRLLARYLDWYSRSGDFLRQCVANSSGSTNRVRLDEVAFRQMRLPLPPLPEQERIVAWLDSLAARVSAAKTLWSERIEDYRQLTRGLLFTSDARPEPTPFSTLLTRRPLDVEVEPDGEYPFGGVYCFGRGMFRREPKRGSEFAYKQLTRIHAGEFCYPKLMAWEGAFAVVPPECDGCVVSPEFPVFTINSELVLPEVLDAYFRLPETWETLAGSSTGTNLRRRRLNPTTLLAADMPLPPMALQEKFRAVTNHLKAAEAELGAIETDLAALMPSALAQVFGG
jgi:type I restriction enzyme S subunit